MANTKSDEHGLKLTEVTPVDERLYEVLFSAWQSGFTVQSDLARATAELVAMAATMGLISTQVMPGVFSRDWQITTAGRRWMDDYESTTQ